MPARAKANLFDTVDNRLAVSLQNGNYDKILVGTAKTTGASPIIITWDSVTYPDSNGTGGRLKVPEGGVLGFNILLVAANGTADPATSLTYGQGFEIKGVIRNLNGTTALPAAGVTPVALDVTASHTLPVGNVIVTADDTNDALQISVTGVAATTHYWKATAFISAVSFFGS